MLSRSATTTRKAQEMPITIATIIGCLSYPRLVNMTRPDLAFACSQLSKFVQYPGIVHGMGRLILLVMLIENRKSMTGYWMYLNGGAIYNVV